MDNETLMNAADAIRLGFADATIEKAQIIEDVAASAGGHPLHAKRLADAVLANAGIPRTKRRAMFAAIKNGGGDYTAELRQGLAAGLEGLHNDISEIRALLKEPKPREPGDDDPDGTRTAADTIAPSADDIAALTADLTDLRGIVKPANA
jgi:hypothetical protein